MKLYAGSPVVGENNNNNDFDSSLVVGNRDGSLLERTEYIINMITGGAADLRVSQSVAGTVEENGLLQFTIGLMDIDSGAIASANINISSITQTMERSRDGSSWSTMTAPSFSKADGQVYCSYQFLAAEWQTGDMYRLTLSGITCTIGTETAYVPAMVWSNIVVETEDIKNDIQYLYAEADGGTTYPTKVVDNSILSLIMTKDSGGDTSDFDNSTDSLEAISDKITDVNEDIGDYSGQTNLKSLKDALGIPDVSGKSLYTCVITDRLDNATYGLSAIETLVDDIESELAKVPKSDSNVTWNSTALASINAEVDSALDTIVPASPTAGSLNDILSKAAGGNTFDKTTDSLEAIRDRIDAIASSGAGVSQVFVKSITSAANAGNVTIATVGTQAVVIDSISVSAKTASQTDLTSAAIYGGASNAITFLNTADMAKANIDDVDECVSWYGAQRLAVGKTIVMDLIGSGATPVDLTVSITYHAEVSGGVLS